ncbi:MAG: bifunctional glycosyltransferase/CDP-glycerol:glycerophosphate glycerophosphotransferase [Microbacterium gubbeenense]
MTVPTYSIVVPLYNTARWLPDLLGSLERQRERGRLFELECIFVDDSSPDDAGHIASEWLARTGITGHVLTQPNSGVSAARNNGLDNATGEWITFIDSDDFISDGYVAGVERFLNSLGERVEEVSLVSCNVARYDEARDRRDYAHPLRAKFNRGDRVYALDEHPEFIQSQAASAFFPVERLRASGVRFLEGLHAAEDALFVSSFLFTQERPALACVASSDYFYRQRASGDSAVDQYKRNPDYYFGRFSRGYLPLFERAASERGATPRWLGEYFLYDMRWFFPREDVVRDKATHLSGEEKAEVLRLISAVLAHLEPEWVRDYSVTGMSLEHRNLMLALMGAPLLSDGYVRSYGIDPQRDLVQLRYYFTAELPDETITVGGRPARIAASKVRRLDYLGQTVLRQRILWVEAEDDLEVLLDRTPQKVITSHLPAPQYSASRARLGFDSYVDPIAIPTPDKVERPLMRRIAGRALREAAALVPRAFENTRYHAQGQDLRRPRAAKAVQVYAQHPHSMRRFRDAWIFIDRVAAADDNAEALYWHVRENRPDINAFFVIRRDSAHWDRLKQAGARLLAYGSMDHKAALMHAEFVISAHLDVEIVRQMPDHYYWKGRPSWRFVYLQHGVLQHDLSIWFNSKPIDLITTASVDEQQSIVEDGSSYTLTTLQARPTGFPRHDAIVRGRRAAEGTPRRLVLFAPTWRNNMMGAKTGDGPERAMSVDLESSEFGQNWFGLLRDPRLCALAERFDLDIAFLPHPNFRDKTPADLLPEHVTLMTTVPDMTELLLSSALVVTDYSSIFFDAAIAGADISYFQFDRDVFLSGGHTYVPGYWSYEEHGFGPVATDVDGMIDVLTGQLDPERSAEFDAYRERLDRTLPYLDGLASDRVLQEILGLG